ncbi:MAG TPA: radical SAM protein [Pseudobdellovibrionaceae bacterium]|nr:radical SAM protein [Pseudobdellovibrionaceae bacterium]
MKISHTQHPASIDELFRTARDRHQPLSVTIELTQGCNLACAHCYNFDRTSSSNGVSAYDKDRPTLSPERVDQLLSEIRRAGGLFVSFTGGEVTLAPHLERHIRRARELSLNVRLKTNGTRFSNDQARKLFAAGARDLDVSLYGAKPETHDRFTARPGSHQRTLNGIVAARDAGFQVSVSIILHRGNYTELPEMIQWCREQNVRFETSTEITERYDGSEGADHLRLREEDLRQLVRGPAGSRFLGNVNTTGDVQCACARTNAGISHTGIVLPCIGAPWPAGDVTQQSFDEIWSSSVVFQQIRALKFEDFKSCVTCEVRSHCPRSSGTVLANTGEFTGCDPWLKMEARVLKEESNKKSEAVVEA